MPRKHSSQAQHNTNPVVSTLSCPSVFFPLTANLHLFSNTKVKTEICIMSWTFPWLGTLAIVSKEKESSRKSRAGFIIKRLFKHQTFHMCTYPASQRSKSQLSTSCEQQQDLIGCWLSSGPKNSVFCIKLRMCFQILRTARLEWLLCWIWIYQSENVER